MSEPIPESIPTSADPRSRRPVKKSRPNPSANPLAHEVSNLFSDPDKEIALPLTSAERAARSAAIAASQVPEVVANVQGSSAGAGSGEFHVYKASRRREYDRVKKMDEEVEKEKADEEWERKQEERRREDEEKRVRNKAKRDKKKGKQKGGDSAKDGGLSRDVGKGGGGVNGSAGAGVPRPALRTTDGGDAGEDVRARDGAQNADKQEEIGVVIHEDD